MNNANRIFIIAAMLVVGAMAGTVFGQSSAPKQLSDSEFAGSIELRMKQVEDVNDLDDAAKAKIKELYKQAQEEMRAAAKWMDLAAKNEKLAADAPKDLEQVRAELAKPVQPLASPSPDDSLTTIEQTISSKESDLEKLRKSLADDEAALKNADRRAKVIAQVNKAKEALSSLNDQLQLPAPANESPVMSSAVRIVLESRRRAVEREIAAYEQELKAFEARVGLMPLLRDRDARRVAAAEQEIRQLQAFVNRRRTHEAEQQVRRASIEANQAGKSPPAVQELVQANARLAEERKKLVAKIVGITQHRDEVDLEYRKVAKLYRDIQEKVKAAEKSKTTELIGVDLRKKRESLPKLQNYRDDILFQEQLIGCGEMEMQPLQEERGPLMDVDGLAREFLQKLQVDPDDSSQESLLAAVREALKNKRDYIDALMSDYSAYSEKILDLIGTERKLIGETEECARYIDARVLWVASAKPLGVGDLKPAGEAFIWLVSPSSLGDVGHTLLTDIQRNKLIWLPTLGLLVFLIYWRFQFRKKLQEIGEKAGRGNCYRFLPTMESTLLTALVAVGWPGLMWYFGWRLNGASDASTLCKTFGEGLIETSRVYLALELLRHTCCSRGLGESHFHWPVPALNTIRQNIRWFSVPALSLMCVAVTMAWQHNDHWDASLGRISFIAALVCFAWVLHRVLRPSSDVFRAMIAERRGGLTERFRYVWYPLIVLLPIVLAIQAAAGYHYTSRQLVIRAILCIYVLVGGIVCRALLMRWALVNQRKLAIEQARQRRANAPSENGGSSDIPDLALAGVLERDLATINTQSRRLIEYSLGVACLLIIFSAWVDVLPALDSVNKRVGAVQVTTFKEDPATGSYVSSEEWRALKVSDFLLALIILATTVTAARNIPGLLEMAILQHLPFDAGARYAIATISRYTLTVVGVSWCCVHLGIGWSKIQWLAAAMSLGLGFGLQEIFANFVSGLIILFERPVRVGDVVTIDTVTGVVSRIRMRATTITDADRKELIIPNKEFITGRVLNWTLTDSVNRLVVNVGVAYGTDTELTASLLLKIAQSHPLILKDPRPEVTLESFGESSLNFVLRCFLPNMENRLAVIHQLHMTVERELRAANISIPFPARDIFIHTAEATAPAAQPTPQPGTTWSTDRAA